MNIAVVGAGVIGISSAYYLKKQGHQVTVFESLPSAGLETSYANGGLITPSLCDPWNSPGILRSLLKTIGRESAPIRLQARVLPSLLSWGAQFLKYSSPHYYLKNFKKNVLLANYSMVLMDELLKESDWDFSYQKSGTLKIYRDTKSALQLKNFVELSTQLGIPCELLDVESTIAKEPALLPIQRELLGSVYYPEDASGDAFCFTNDMVQYLKNHQVPFFFNSVVRLAEDGQGYCFIKMGDDQIKFDRIVVAAGCHSRDLCRPLGIALPTQPLKGYSITLNYNDWSEKPIIPVIDHELHAAITPLGNQIRVAGTAELSGYNKTLNLRRIQNLKQLLLKVYPESAQYIINGSVSNWTGLRPTSVDGVPFIGATKYENLYINTGHGHLGWTMALGSGRILSDLISGETPGLEMKEYSLQRLIG